MVLTFFILIVFIFLVGFEFCSSEFCTIALWILWNTPHVFHYKTTGI